MSTSAKYPTGPVTVEWNRAPAARGSLAAVVEPYLPEVVEFLVRTAVDPETPRGARRVAWKTLTQHRIVVRGPDGAVWDEPNWREVGLK